MIIIINVVVVVIVKSESILLQIPRARQSLPFNVRLNKSKRKEMFYLTTHSKHSILFVKTNERMVMQEYYKTRPVRIHVA